VILVDWNTPVMDGLTFIWDQTLPQVPVVWSTPAMEARS